MKFNVVASATVTGPQGPMPGWYLELEVNSQGVNGMYQSFEDLVPGAAAALAGALTQFVADQLTDQVGATEVVWDYVQVSRPSVDMLFEVP